MRSTELRPNFSKFCAKYFVKLLPSGLSEGVGHSSISETMDTYGQLFEGDVSDLADRLDQSVRSKKVSKKMTLAI